MDFRTIRKAIDYLSNAIELTANVCFMGAVLVVVISVFLRLLHIASPWADEGACLLFIWTVFLSAAIGLKSNVHIRIDILLVRIPQQLKEVLIAILNMLCLIFCIGVLYGTYQMLQAATVMRSPAMELSMIYFYLPLFIGFAMMIMYLTIFVLDFTLGKLGVSGGG
ncbi:MAG: TRAP transporter small permease [Deltaproteobacteria bacterium]|nr:TRAP transporter small permease [Deltaproteobacteria bacterium]